MAFISSGGSVSNPAFGFSAGNTNTGIYLPGTDSIAFVTDGTARGRFAAGGTLNLGPTLGTIIDNANISLACPSTIRIAGDTIESSFNSHLQIGDGSMTKDPRVTFSITGGYRWAITGDTSSSANSILSFSYLESTATEKRILNLTRDDRVGIGTIAPSAYSTTNTNVANTFEVCHPNQNTLTSACVISCSNTSTHSSQLLLTATGGTYASKTAVANGRRVGLLSMNAYNGTTYTGVSNQSVNVDGTVTAGSPIPGYWTLTTNSGSGLAPAIEASKTQDLTLHNGKVKFQSLSWNALAAGTRTITITGLVYGWFKLYVGGGDGNTQRVGLEVIGTGNMWSGGTGYGVTELHYNGSGASATRTQNNASYVVVVTAGSNQCFGQAYLLTGSYDGTFAVMAIT